MNSKLLDAEKVIVALELAKDEINIATYYNRGDDEIAESIRYFIHNETKKMIETAISSFVISLTFRLRSCQVDDYPCALCYDNEESTNE